MKKQMYSIAAIITGCLWGCTGLFTRSISAMGLTSLQMLIIRAGTAALCFGILILIKNPKLFKIKLKDLWLFLAVGIAGQLLFSFFYYTAINMMSVSTACILLYLSPAIVMILAMLIFKDKVGVRGWVAVALCVLGCAFVSGFGGSITTKGLIFGLSAAVCFALINIFDRMLLQRGYDSRTVNFYLLLIAALGSMIVVAINGTGVSKTFETMFANGSNFLWCFLNGIVTAFIPYLCFSFALGGEKSGKVSILASTEPVMATLISIIVFKEAFGIFSIIGIILVLGSIVLMNTGSE